MTSFENTVRLRGYLTEDAEAPTSDFVSRYSYGVLVVCTDPDSWNPAENVSTSQTVHHRLICIGPYLRGETQGLKRGDHIEIEGEICASETGSQVRVLHVCKLASGGPR